MRGGGHKRRNRGEKKEDKQKNGEMTVEPKGAGKPLQPQLQKAGSG